MGEFSKGRGQKMYRADDFIIPQVEKVKTGVYHRLAEAMRRGCKLRPMKARGYFQRKDGSACALGAAAAGNGRWRPKKKYSMWGLIRVFPELRDTVTHPFTYLPLNLRDVIITLNDDIDCSREAIADWLCRVGGCKHEVSELFAPL
jgi:hypothetical protein